MYNIEKEMQKILEQDSDVELYRKLAHDKINQANKILVESGFEEEVKLISQALSESFSKIASNQNEEILFEVE